MPSGVNASEAATRTSVYAKISRFVRSGPPVELDSLLWDAFGGNRSMEEVLTRRASRIPFAFCGHTHRAREVVSHGIRGYNIGGDYHFTFTTPGSDSQKAQDLLQQRDVPRWAQFHGSFFVTHRPFLTLPGLPFPAEGWRTRTA